MHDPSTWHHGLVADYWATVNLDAPEVDLYRPHLRSPVLDAGCGAGRLLVPLREEGFDIDGCDASADMIERCRRRAPDATLWVSTLHDLDPPRRYAAIVCSGVLGLGSTREQDIRAVKRLHDALLPGAPLYSTTTNNHSNGRCGTGTNLPAVRSPCAAASTPSERTIAAFT
jgi:2-polyprenyl-3-methyl-5-hydroxy-6-metoxy-1,4-benzoquinol methylase